MNGRKIFRGIDFHLGSLDHHRIVNDTVEEVVLTIDTLLPKFSGQQYSCQYDTVNGPVTSGNIILKIEDVPKVTNMLFERLSNSTVQLSWKQNDPCHQTASFNISIFDNQEKKQFEVSIPASGEEMAYHTRLNLFPNIEYTVSITAVAHDGRKSAVTRKEYQRKIGLTNEGTHFNLCEVEPHSCGLYIVAGALLLVSVILGIAILACMVHSKWKKEKKIMASPITEPSTDC
jgi:hypothetical protein